MCCCCCVCVILELLRNRGDSLSCGAPQRHQRSLSWNYQSSGGELHAARSHFPLALLWHVPFLNITRAAHVEVAASVGDCLFVMPASRHKGQRASVQSTSSFYSSSSSHPQSNATAFNFSPYPPTQSKKKGRNEAAHCQTHHTESCLWVHSQSPQPNAYRAPCKGQKMRTFPPFPISSSPPLG